MELDKEMKNMSRNNVWTFVPRSEANGLLMNGLWNLKEKPDKTLKARWRGRRFTEPFAENTYACSPSHYYAHAICICSI